MAAGHEACSGCSLCLPACPVWRATRDIRFTPQGRVKALQHGATAMELEASVDSCTLCGSCEPACPENIALTTIVTGLRTELARLRPERIAPVEQARHEAPRAMEPHAEATVVVPNTALRSRAPLLEKACALLGSAGIARDDGADIALAIEQGAPVPEARRRAFLAPLSRAKRVVVADGLLFRALRDWLPRTRIDTFGRALSALKPVRAALRSGDLYVIEPRGYHADHARSVRYYDAMRASLGCAMNLDLQRLAVPARAGRFDSAAQARWVLEGRRFERIVVEDLDDTAAFAAVSGKPVLHLCELA